MKLYGFDTIFTFGKYKGKTVKEILELDAKYINWCQSNLNHFYLKDDLIFLFVLVGFTLSPEAEKKRDENYKNFLGSHFNSQESSFSKYGGYNGWDDDTIDNAFDGDPESSWNID